MWAFSADSADELWREVRSAILGGDSVPWVEGRTGRTKEIRTALLTLRHPRDRWVVRRTPVNPAAALAEVIWIVLGRRDAQFVNFWNPALPRYAGEDENYYGAYGYRLRKSYGFDQLAVAAEALLANADSRQVCLSVWHPETDMPRVMGVPRSRDIPCNVFSMLKRRDHRLHWTQVMRSNDFWLGLPVNLVQFTSLQEILAGWIGCEVGDYHHLSDSLHVYEPQWAELRQLPEAPHPPRNPDDLRLGYEASMDRFEEIGRRMEVMLNPGTDVSELSALLPPEHWQVGYANVLRVILADAARRKRHFDLAGEVMGDCTNPLISLLWKRWRQRKEQ